MSARGPVRVYSHEEEDVFAAEETKLHTLSHRQIADMLESAAAEEHKIPTPVPPSGIVAKVTEAQDEEDTLEKFPRSPLPVVWNDDEDGLEPTRLSERIVVDAQPPALPFPVVPSPALVKMLTAPVAPPVAAVALPEARRVAAPAAHQASMREVNRRALMLGVAAFAATLLPALAYFYSTFH